MKLATALTERADLQRRIAELSGRLNSNAKVQEGETPAEDPATLIQELNSCIERLEELMSRINMTNSQTSCDGATITQMLAKRDALSLKVKVMREFLEEASHLVDRYSRSEIKVIPTVKVPDLRRKVDSYAKELRVLDEKLQELNWITELL